MNNTTRTCPHCGSNEVKDGYHSLFRCGSHYYGLREGGMPTITEQREGYKFHETLECAQKQIKILTNRLVKVEEYIKKQTEVPKKSLKSLEQHNNEAYNTFAAINNLNSGFACPKCGEELYYYNPNAMLATYPPKRGVQCNKCNHTDYVY
jgi:DNA-directed RNA polymerase subunit M/transcription elongation factor TFIIS